MKKSFSLLFIFIGLFLLTASNTSKKSAKRVILLGLDGISIEGFQKAVHPNIDKLFEAGVISMNTRTVMPSVTMPNWTSHLTAAGPEQHGVFGNDWTMEKHPLSPQETDAEGYFPSIFKWVKEQVPQAKTAFYYNWANLIKPFNKKYLDEIHFEENDQYLYNYNAAFDFILKNKNRPTLTFLYSVHADHAGHKHKWMSQEYIRAIEEVDAEIGRLVDKLKAEGLFADSHFLLFTDHGGIGNGHGGTSPNEMLVPWMISGPGIRKNEQLQSPNSNANTAAVVAHLFQIKELPASCIGKVPSGIFIK
ncbi:alkaline phosphatase family protein [Marinilongibacter aquaticus]|uniref:alkaline phosphatase family protein n=1 Tax=Marinilongibacter aquaticus TaxID=2975157 RepID=UPI0021BD2077|nr:alkaline phosphatase family protein [Marinilongibacter aquaticus]UBM59056.1 alkaline phosphatase family protein [Marinilongibacter aquaticus]